MDKPAMRMSDEDKRIADGLSAGADATAPPSALGVWVLPLALGAVGFLVVFPFDGAIHDAASRLASRLSGDLRRELHAWQQYGQGFSILVIGLAIWLADPARRIRLWDLALVALVAKIVSQAAKMLIGRPRPRPEFDDPNTFLGPWGEYPIVVDGKARLVHAWDTAAGAGPDLWSMPSSHTLFAAAVSVFVASLYPRLTWLVVALTVLVGVGRVLFDGHWPTDVIVGASVGFTIGGAISWKRLASRLLQRRPRRAEGIGAA